MSHAAGFSRVFALLAREGIDHCMLRDDLRGPSPPRDLDLLIAPERFDDALGALQRELGYRLRYDKRATTHKAVLVGLHEEHPILLDLHARVVQRGIVYLREDEVLARRRAMNDYFLPDESDLFLVLLVHNLIGKRRIQDKHLGALLELRARWFDDPHRTATITTTEAVPLLREFARDLESIAASESLARAAGSRLEAALRSGDPTLGRRMLRKRLGRLVRRFDPRPRAKLIALMGVDGAGKSSLIESLSSQIESAGLGRPATLYMGPWGHYHLAPMRSLKLSARAALTIPEWWSAIVSPDRPHPTWDEVRAALRARMTDSEASAVPASVRDGSVLYLTLRMLRSELNAARFFSFLALEMSWRHVLAYRLRRRGVTVIADRYAFDLLTGSMHDMVARHAFVRGLLCRVFPGPSRGFVLHASKRAILDRKQDLDEETLEAFQAFYLELADEHRFEIVDTERPAVDVARGMIARHLDDFVVRA